MPIGTSDGQQFADEFNLALNRPITQRNQPAPQVEPGQGSVDAGINDIPRISYPPRSGSAEWTQAEADRYASYPQTFASQQPTPSFETGDPGGGVSALPADIGASDTTFAPGAGKAVFDKTVELSNKANFPVQIANALMHPVNTAEEIKGAATKLIDAFKLPGDVYAGKIDPMSDTAIGRAADLAGAVVMGPAPIAAKVADGTLGSFAGVGSLTARRSDLSLAIQMAERGMDKEQVYAATGFFKGLDNKWRYEIPDHNVKFTDQFVDAVTKSVGNKDFLHEMDLSDAIKHPELFKAYPQLKNIKLQIDNELSSLGAYLHDSPANVFERNVGGQKLPPSQNIISINMDKILDNPSIHPLEVVMHEVQHAIQRQEGFYSGSSPTASLSKALDFLNTQAQKEYKKNPDVGEHFKRITDLYDLFRTNPKTQFNEPLSNVLYRLDPGEIEARTVGARATQSKARELTPTEHMELEGDPLIIPGSKAVANATSEAPSVFPSGYLDKVPLEQRLNRNGITHPGFRWEIVDRQTGKVIGAPLTNSIRARQRVDQLDNKYGGYRYQRRAIRADNPTEEELNTLQNLGISLDK